MMIVPQDSNHWLKDQCAFMSCQLSPSDEFTHCSFVELIQINNILIFSLDASLLSRPIYNLGPAPQSPTPLNPTFAESFSLNWESARPDPKCSTSKFSQPRIHPSFVPVRNQWDQRIHIYLTPMSVVNAGSCKSGRFLVLDKPLLRFSGADAACARVGKKLATIDAVFGGSGTAPPPLYTSIKSSQSVGNRYLCQISARSGYCEVGEVWMLILPFPSEA